MAFIPRQYDEGHVMDLPMTASTTLTKHNLCKMSSGYLVAASAGDNVVEYVALETKTSGTGDGSSKISVLKIDDRVQLEALTGTTPVQATHVGNSYDLAGAASLDLTATTDLVFRIDSIVNATDKLVSGHFHKFVLQS